MALKTKTDYYGLATSGWEVSDTSENRSVGYVGEIVAPEVNYVATSDATLASVVLGSVKTVLGKKVALGGITINTSAGAAPTMTATGS